VSNLTKQDVIIAAWQALEAPAVGAEELQQIQLELARVFGQAASDSPASIARVLADEGVDLLHPDVLEFDARWRAAKLHSQTLEFGSLAEALITVKELEDSAEKSDRLGYKARVLAAREDCLLRAGSAVLEERERAEAKEIASWLGVWLNTPDLFADWLELRLLSPQFLKKFGEN